TGARATAPAARARPGRPRPPPPPAPRPPPAPPPAPPPGPPPAPRSTLAGSKPASLARGSTMTPPDRRLAATFQDSRSRPASRSSAGREPTPGGAAGGRQGRPAARRGRVVQGAHARRGARAPSPPRQ